MSSSRRGGGEINILAMLDRQSGKPRARRKLAWIGAGALLACTLAGGLAWLLHAPSGGFDDHRIAADLPEPKPAAALPVRAPASLPEPPRHVEQRPRHGAAIVDPPSHQAAGVFPADMKAAATMPPPAAPAPARARAAKPAAHAAAPRAGATRTASISPRQEVPARPRRAAAAPKPAHAPAAVDTDVALISAIIQHVNQHGELQGDAKSPTKRLPTQP